MSIALSHDETMLVRRALGLESSKSVNRNRVAVHANGDMIPLARGLADRGALVRDPTADYGSMRVFRVTTDGASAIGKKLRTDLRFNH
ncbi:hypothetical protein [Rhodopseudomonas palustris]|uniref:hypothetical protein n=1 Tax=Rhodopseudomonas palustris TaxID=1076 RepID=UPI000641DBFC|nr:hypothetical protein [Rhodopseudomonas palustris]